MKTPGRRYWRHFGVFIVKLFYTLFYWFDCLLRTAKFLLGIARESLKNLFPLWVQECWPETRRNFTWLASFYLYKTSNGNTRTMWETCSKLTIKAPERRCLHRYNVFTVNFEQILHVLVFPLLTLSKWIQNGHFLFWYSIITFCQCWKCFCQVFCSST